ncbi:hypothetical protein [Alloactinosynnema sp. L-07]|nr:hypothetical protein [Alloactinosynnema sp. L-07]
MKSRRPEAVLERLRGASRTLIADSFGQPWEPVSAALMRTTCPRPAVPP